jgi:leader peptidase (prepilin peptidase) / N-methyltransferase
VVVAALVALICGLYGLVIGSFLNVVIWRVPRDQSIVRPPSHCPGCNTQIAVKDNLPLLSWAMLRGKCRHCDEKISARYPLIELLTGALWAAVGAVYYDSWALPAYLLLTAGLIALSAIDLERYILPTKIIRVVGVGVAVLLAFASLMEHNWGAYRTAIISAFAAYAFFFLVHQLYPKGMGFGDVRLSFVLGFSLGWLGWKYAVGGLFLGFLYGSILGIVVLAAKGAEGRKIAIPFGPFLAAGTMTFILWGAPIIDWYVNFSGRS